VIQHASNTQALDCSPLACLQPLSRPTRASVIKCISFPLPRSNHRLKYCAMKPPTISTPDASATTAAAVDSVLLPVRRSRHATTTAKAMWRWWMIAIIFISVISFNVHQHYYDLHFVGTLLLSTMASSLSSVVVDYHSLNTPASSSAASASAAVHAPVDDLTKQHSHVLNTYSMLLNNVKLQRTSSSSNIMLSNARMTNSKKASYSSSRNQQHDNIDSPLVELSFKLSDVDKYVPRIAALKDGMQHELWASEPFLKVSHRPSVCPSLPTCSHP